MTETKCSLFLNQEPGTCVTIKPDYCLINDWKGDQVMDQLEGELLYDKTRIFMVMDHESPAGSIPVARQQKKIIDLAEKESIYLSHNVGIGYQMLIDQIAKKGDIVLCCGKRSSYLGAAGILAVLVTPAEMAQVLNGKELTRTVPESVHIRLTGSLKPNATAKDFILTIISQSETSYQGKCLVFHTDSLSFPDKSVIAAMASDLGTSYVLFDEEDAVCSREISLDTIEAVVALPDSRDIKPVYDLPRIDLQGVFIGGCMSGKIEDLRFAAQCFKGKRVAKEVRVMISPVSAQVQIQAMDEGLTDIFLDAGAYFMAPGCGSCKATAYGYMDEGEVMLSAGGYNFKGSGGSQESMVYLCSLNTAVASALAGYITSPKS